MFMGDLYHFLLGRFSLWSFFFFPWEKKFFKTNILANWVKCGITVVCNPLIEAHMLWALVTAFEREIKIPLTSKHSLSKSSYFQGMKALHFESRVSPSKAKCTSTQMSSVVVRAFRKWLFLRPSAKRAGPSLNITRFFCHHGNYTCCQPN